MKSKLLTTLLCGCIIASSISAPVFATDSTTNLSHIIDTTSYTQEQYLNSADISGKSAFTTLSDDKVVQLTCESFLAIAKASVRKPNEYDPTKVVLLSSLDKNTIQYRLTDYTYQAELNKALDQTISSDRLVFTDFKVSYDGAQAVASIVESYTYYIDDGFDGESFRRKMYTFELQNVDGKWMIADVTTNDPWELEMDFEYKPLDVQAEILNLLAEDVQVKADPSVIDNNKLKEPELGARATMYTWTYDASAAVDYAEDHYDDTSNSVFGYTSGNNCQNFSSQCVWAGLGGSGSSTTARPAVPTSRAGTDVFNVWCRNQNTSYYDEFYFNWSWDNARGFMKLMQASSSSAEGPYGNGYYSDGVELADVGDVLCVNWEGTPDEDSMDHAMFVTEVTGTSGSRTKSNVKIAAHTSATNSAYQTLSSYTSTSIDNFGRSEIWRGNYSVEQP